MNRWPRLLAAPVDVVNRRGKATGVRLVRARKGRHFIHPRHLVDTPGRNWYLAHLASDDIVLDVSCGNGARTIAAAQHAKAVGIGHDRVYLPVAEAMAAARGLGNASFLPRDLVRLLPFPDSMPCSSSTSSST